MVARVMMWNLWHIGMDLKGINILSQAPRAVKAN
jgi:hypothetical protein